MTNEIIYLPASSVDAGTFDQAKFADSNSTDNPSGPGTFAVYVRAQVNGQNTITVTQPAALTITDQPVITGTPQTTELLTASDGMATGKGNVRVIARQWLRDGTSITGATTSTYTVTEADVGTTLTFRVVWQDDLTRLLGVSAGVVAKYAPPVAANGLVDQTFGTGTGVQTYDVAGDFSVAGDPDLSGITWAIPGNPDPANITISSGGVVRIDTEATGPLLSASIVVTATNSGGSAQSGFSIEVTEPVAADTMLTRQPDGTITVQTLQAPWVLTLTREPDGTATVRTA